MASTLRLPEGLDARVRQRAQREGLSQHTLIVKLLTAHVDDDVTEAEHREAVTRTAEQLLPRWQPLLDRLART